MSGAKIDRDQIGEIVDRVVARLGGEEKSVPTVATVESSSTTGMFNTVDEAVTAATEAFHQLGGASLAMRDKMISAMRQAALDAVPALSAMAVEETGLGRVDDKLVKNRLAINKTPGVESLGPEAWTGDDGMTITERAPYGIIGSITPCTNPTETVICNAIGMIAAGNAVVFNAHPTASQTTAKTIGLLNDAIVSAGGPPNLLTAVATPTIGSAQELMSHPGIRLLVVTGGPAVVRTAMNSGKKVIAAGPGNPPAVVDETANIDDAARHLIAGASFDNNIVCVVEKVFIVVDAVADQLKTAMKQHGGYELSPPQLRRVEKLVIDRLPEGEDDHGAPNKTWVGKDAVDILKAAEINAPPETRLAFADVTKDHPLVSIEQLMPVIPLVRVADVDEAIALAVQVEHGFCHTAVMHSTNIDNLSKMARIINTSIFIKNGPSYAGLGAGGEGYASFTIASPTGEGLTQALDFTRERRCVMKDRFRIV